MARGLEVEEEASGGRWKRRPVIFLDAGRVLYLGGAHPLLCRGFHKIEAAVGQQWKAWATKALPPKPGLSLVGSGKEVGGRRDGGGLRQHAGEWQWGGSSPLMPAGHPTPLL
ncbi:hypothetical protein E2562_004318 [Oryza meyeriana var. granulata]|uniref:Uncharacterized protein n=1 Tax=Oryza meyeriana var. granulata TaxID=110450 RepID=A0A6G1BRX7_9ORYZ|nr:hypothetical protein E2562_004318 [Oryza meyeriana var. granulata]